MSGGWLSLLGLTRRAGKLAVGEEAAAQAAQEHRARLILLAADAGETTAVRTMRLDSEKLPVVTVAADGETLGAAVGFARVAAVAVCDLGLADAICRRLAEENPQAAQAAELLSQRQSKALRRKADTARHGRKSRRKAP